MYDETFGSSESLSGKSKQQQQKHESPHSLGYNNHNNDSKSGPSSHRSDSYKSRAIAALNMAGMRSTRGLITRWLTYAVALFALAYLTISFMYPHREVVLEGVRSQHCLASPLSSIHSPPLSLPPPPPPPRASPSSDPLSLFPPRPLTTISHPARSFLEAE